MWKIIAYNGTIWESERQMTIYEAIKLFVKKTKLHEMDIKLIIRDN